ncbi:hypothetical protein QYE76_029789 [Lolium multiflorum]|uniref:Uncharacterized protein n=1 Tax=Lolium multiflorum TaxID=4521 RepID=A0AAD8QPW5_LOLMU|nr:hypothetical protein QYE76_029789 [Lolium multiflorum]
MAEEQITYKDLPAEHKKKYDELKAICEAELIGSFETTRSHNIKLKGNTCPSHGVNTVDLSHSIREPGFSFSVNMARLVNCHSADKAESSHSRGKDKEEAVPRDRPQDDDRRYLIEEEVRSTRYQRPLSAHLLNKCEQQYDRRRRYDEDDERYRRSDAEMPGYGSIIEHGSSEERISNRSAMSTTNEGQSLGRSQEGDQEDVGRRIHQAMQNAGATYQRAMNYIFHDLIGKLVEIYIDDVVVKSVATDGHLEDLRRVLDRTRKFGLRMNPKKCAFGVTAGQRFISNLSGRIEPFMGLVKIKPDEEFRWGAEQQAFDDIKEYLTKPPVLVPPRQDRPFYIYLSVADTSIASVVVQVYDGLEKVVFYLSRRMLDAETRYPEIEKLCLCLFFTCTKIQHILVSADIIVICKSDVIKHMLSAPVLKGRLGKWMFALSEFEIRYQPAKAVKGQALADLIAERINTDVAALSVRAWAMFFDGSVCEDGCGIGVLLVSPRGATYSFSIKLADPCTNNVAEYEAICKGMKLLLEAGAEAVEIFGDSKLVISQLTEEYKCESESLFPFWANGQAEASNKSLIKLIKRKIDEHPKRWHEVLSEALWAYRMSCHGAIKTTPYQLVYGQEAVLPWEVKAGSRRVTFQNDLTAEEYAALISDSIEDATELRLWSLEKIKENKAKVARAYNKKVKPKEFQVDDLVWEAVLPLGTRDKEYGKWSPNWHGPYKVVQVLKGNAYMLEMLDGVKFPVAVNGQHLKKYFPSMWDDGQ